MTVEPPFNCDDHDLTKHVKNAIADQNLKLDFKFGRSDDVSYIVWKIIEAKRYDLILELINAGMVVSPASYREILFRYGADYGAF